MEWDKGKRRSTETLLFNMCLEKINLRTAVLGYFSFLIEFFFFSVRCNYMYADFKIWEAPSRRLNENPSFYI